MAEANITAAAEEVVEKKAPAKKTAAKAPAKKAAAPKKAKAEGEAPAKKTVKKTGKKAAAEAGKVSVKLVRSLAGRKKDQIAVAASLGLTRVGQIRVQPDNAATAGKIKKISHLVEVTNA